MVKVSGLSQSLSESVGSFYIVKGDDTYLLQKTENAFLKLVGEEFRSFNVNHFSMAEGAGANEILDAALTLPVFDTLRLVVVKDIINFSEKLFVDYLNNPNPQTVLIMFENSENLKLLDKKTESLKSLEKFAIIIDCSRLSDSELLSEIDAMLEVAPARTMTMEAKRGLISFTRGDMAKIKGELQKLKAFSDGEISLEAVKELVVPDIETKIFELSSALGKRSNAEALRIADTFIRDSVKDRKIPHIVLSQLVSHYSKLLAVSLAKEESTSEIARLLSVKEGAVFHLKTAAKNYSQVRLKKIVETLCDIQFKSLSESVDSRISMMDAVAMLMVL